MGHGLSCAGSICHNDFFAAVQGGDLGAVEASIRDNPSLVARTTIYDHLSALHIAAANGHVDVLSAILDRSVNLDVVNRCKQTPVMLAAMYGKLSCVQKLLEAGANILMFDYLNGRTCLHHAAYHGHYDCLQAILSTAHVTTIADSWGFSRFVNVRDDNGATPLHLAARQGQPDCVHILLDNGALVSPTTGRHGYLGSSPLHLAAWSGSLDCVRELLARGADRFLRDSSGRIPYTVALKRGHGACAALLNPSAAEPLVWPSPLKFISELDSDAKAILEAALMEANRERENKILKGTSNSLPSPSHSDEAADGNFAEVPQSSLFEFQFPREGRRPNKKPFHKVYLTYIPNLGRTGPGVQHVSSFLAQVSESELCCICFEQVCSIEVRECGHQMCARCMLALCCHSKRNPTNQYSQSPTCPFCRSSIARLAVAKTKMIDEGDKETTSKARRSRKSRNFSEGSSSFKGASSATGPSGKMNCGAGFLSDNDAMMDKPLDV